MALFGSSKKNSTPDPNAETRKVEKMLASEAKHEQKNLDHAIKDLEKLEKTHNKSIKAADKAQHSLDKTVKNEHKIAKELNEAEHKHENAVSSQRNASKTLELKQQHESRLNEEFQQRKASVDGLQQKKATNDATRESKLAKVHQQAAERAQSRAGSIDSNRGTGVAGASQGAGTGTVGVDAQGTSVGAEERM